MYYYKNKLEEKNYETKRFCYNQEELEKTYLSDEYYKALNKYTEKNQAFNLGLKIGQEVFGKISN